MNLSLVIYIEITFHHNLIFRVKFFLSGIFCVSVAETCPESRMPHLPDPPSLPFDGVPGQGR